MTFNIELTPEQEARLIAAATAQGIAPETLVRQFVLEHLPEPINGNSAAETPTIASPELIDEDGVLVLASIPAHIVHWDSLVEREREARIDALNFLHSQ